MTAYVALFRGINVGGRHNLPMQELRNLLGRNGCEDVKTHIQSGNAVFRSAQEVDALSNKIRAAINEQFGFAPTVCLLTIDDYRSIVAARRRANSASICDRGKWPKRNPEDRRVPDRSLEVPRSWVIPRLRPGVSPLARHKI